MHAPSARRSALALVGTFSVLGIAASCGQSVSYLKGDADGGYGSASGTGGSGAAGQSTGSTSGTL